MERNQSEMGHVALAQSALETVAADMSPSVLEACRADAVLFCFDTVVAGSKSIAAHSDAGDADLIAELTAFWDRKQRSFAPYDPGGIHYYVDKKDVQYIFLLLPLKADGRTMGALSVAILRENWVQQGAFMACTQIARLVAMNVVATETRSKLEVDLAEMNQRAHRLRRQAETDPLTGVENKTSFEAKARARLGLPHQPAALVTLDLDHFKQVNDIYGHQFGDLYLQTIARTLNSSLPDSALVGRTGGDEFCMLIDLQRASSTYLDGLLTRLRMTLQRNVALLGKPDLGRASIGISLFPQQAVDYDKLFAMADTALYACKGADRNTTVRYDKRQHGDVIGIHATGAKTADLESVFPAFQPIIDLKTGACAGVEVLARKRGLEGNSDTSASIYWMFGDHHLAPKLTRHILLRALEDLSSLHSDSGSPILDIWLNVTKFDLLDPEFAFDVQATLDCYKINWQSLVIEVNEEIMMGEPGGQIYHSLQEMRQRGARVALDDFGTGYAGLTHIREWPVDIIKLDKSFVRNIATDEHASVVVQALLMIAHSMGQIVVAEGLETEEQNVRVKQLQCDYGQGFLFNRALGIDQLAAYLAPAAPQEMLAS